MESHSSLSFFFSSSSRTFSDHTWVRDAYKTSCSRQKVHCCYIQPALIIVKPQAFFFARSSFLQSSTWPRPSPRSRPICRFRPQPLLSPSLHSHTPSVLPPSITTGTMSPIQPGFAPANADLNLLEADQSFFDNAFPPMFCVRLCLSLLILFPPLLPLPPLPPLIATLLLRGSTLLHSSPESIFSRIRPTTLLIRFF